MKEGKQSLFPKWLEELQQRSWEPEVLLSGIVLYGMFKVPDLLDQFLSFFKLNIFGNSQDIDNLVALFKMGIYWLIAGLILHLICRGIWIGMVGLSYTFPHGIKKDELNYQAKFREKVDRTPAFEDIVIRLEKICSSLFSISFMLFMSLIGGYLFFLVLLILPFTFAVLVLDIGFSGFGFDIFQIYIFFIIGLGLIGLLDFISLGYFRRFRLVAKVYWPLHRLISILTLSRFYRPIYYGVVTNFNKWAFFVFLFLFTTISIIGAGSITDTTYPGDPYSRLSLWGTGQKYSVFSGYYDDQNHILPSARAQIPSDIITSNVLKLFVVANISYESNMLELMSLDSLKKVYPDTAVNALKLMIVDSFFEIRIDEKPIDSLRWYYHYKSPTNQRGYITYIDISDLDEGLHHLIVKGTGDLYSYNFAEIPFYREITIGSVLKKSIKQPQEEKQEDFQPKPFGVR